jgi:hypothetical protein
MYRSNHLMVLGCIDNWLFEPLGGTKKMELSIEETGEWITKVWNDKSPTLGRE